MDIFFINFPISFPFCFYASCLICRAFVRGILQIKLDQFGVHGNTYVMILMDSWFLLHKLSSSLTIKMTKILNSFYRNIIYRDGSFILSLWTLWPVILESWQFTQQTECDFTNTEKQWSIIWKLWWHISATSCQIIMSTCQIFLLTCQFFMSTCQIIISTYQKKIITT